MLVTIFEVVDLIILGYSRKNAHSPDERRAGKSHGWGGGGGGVNVSRDSDGTGTLNLNLHPRSRVTFINVSIVLKNCYAFSNFIILSNCSPLTTFILSFQEHPTTVFSKISVRTSKYCLEFPINWGRLKGSRWPFPIHVQFSKVI